MRPFRAVALVGLGIAFWAGMRAADIREDVAHRFEPLVSAPATLPERVPSTDPAPLAPEPAGQETTPPSPPPRPPEVMVYSYPGPGEANAPAPMYRLRARRKEAAIGVDSGTDDLPARPQIAFAAVSGGRVHPAPRAAPAPPTETPPDMQAAAYDAATRAYAYLRSGDRRAAASAFAVALSLAPDHANAAAWAKEKARLSRWWRASAYVFQRGSDGTLIRTPGLPAASNVLGGGQAAGLIAVSPNPLGRVPVEVFGRYVVPQNGFTRADSGRAQAAVGIAVRPVPRVPITLVAERLFKLGSLGRNDFEFRAYGGTSRRVRGIDVSFFGETGLVGKRPDYFAGAQLLAEKPIKLPGKFDMGLGVGAWGAMQRTNQTFNRLDIGPTLRISHAKAPVQLRVDYRAHVTGNARPGSGVALTLSSSY